MIGWPERPGSSSSYAPGAFTKPAMYTTGFNFSTFTDFSRIRMSPGSR